MAGRQAAGGMIGGVTPLLSRSDLECLLDVGGCLRALEQGLRQGRGAVAPPETEVAQIGDAISQWAKLSSGTSRAPKTDAIASVAGRRATKATAYADARSSHCASSTTHSSGRSTTTSDKRVSRASATSNRSVGSSMRSPNATPMASRLGTGAAPDDRFPVRKAAAAPRTLAPSPPLGP